MFAFVPTTPFSDLKRSDNRISVDTTDTLATDISSPFWTPNPSVPSSDESSNGEEDDVVGDLDTSLSPNDEDDPIRNSPIVEGLGFAAGLNWSTLPSSNERKSHQDRTSPVALSGSKHEHRRYQEKKGQAQEGNWFSVPVTPSATVSKVPKQSCRSDPAFSPEYLLPYPPSTFSKLSSSLESHTFLSVPKTHSELSKVLTHAFVIPFWHILPPLPPIATPQPTLCEVTSTLELASSIGSPKIKDTFSNPRLLLDALSSPRVSFKPKQSSTPRLHKEFGLLSPKMNKSWKHESRYSVFNETTSLPSEVMMKRQNRNSTPHFLHQASLSTPHLPSPKLSSKNFRMTSSPRGIESSPMSMYQSAVSSTNDVTIDHNLTSPKPSSLTSRCTDIACEAPLNDPEALEQSRANHWLNHQFKQRNQKNKDVTSREEDGNGSNLIRSNTSKTLPTALLSQKRSNTTTKSERKSMKKEQVSSDFNSTSKPTESDLVKAKECQVFDESGNQISFGQVLGTKGRVVTIFIRHFWCGLCAHYVSHLGRIFAPESQAYKNLQNQNVKIIIVGTGSWNMMNKYKELYQYPFPTVTDPSRGNQLFKALGMTKRSWDMGRDADKGEYLQDLSMTKMGLTSTVNGLKLPLGSPGDPMQLGGEFAFDLEYLTSDAQNSTDVVTSKPLGPGLCDYLPQPEETDIKCVYTHRMTTSRDHGSFKDLFASVGVDCPSTAPRKKTLARLGLAMSTVKE